MSGAGDPVIVSFLCTWCAYRAADLVGTTRRPYSASVRPLRVVCSGRVSPEMVLQALAEGADGVLVAGCRAGECHRVDGNLKASRRLTMLREVLRQAGVAPERVQMIWAGAADGTVLADAADRMSVTLRELGPARGRRAPEPPLDPPPGDPP